MQRGRHKLLQLQFYRQQRSFQDSHIILVGFGESSITYSLYRFLDSLTWLPHLSWKVFYHLYLNIVEYQIYMIL